MLISDVIGAAGSLTLISLVAASILVGYLVTWSLYDVFFGPLSKFPGPKLWAVSKLVSARVLVNGTDNIIYPQLHAKYGPVVRVGPRQLTFNAGPQAFNDIYGHKKPGQLPNSKHPDFYITPQGQPANIVCAGDADHTRLRKLLSGAFADKALKLLAPTLKSTADLFAQKLIERGANGQKVDMVKFFNCATFDVMGDLTFSENFNMLKDSEYSPWVKTIFAQVKFNTRFRVLLGLHPLLNRLALSLIVKNPYLAKKRLEHERYSNDRVDRRLTRTPERPDMWSIILEKSNGGLSLEEQYATAGLFMVAGTETTATALSGTLFHLLQNPQYLTRLTKEVRSAFISNDEIDLDSIARLKFMNAVLNEGLRIYPPVPTNLPRKTPPGGAIICGEFVPGGVSVGVHHLATYRNADLFKDPYSFRPERWLGDPDFADDDLSAVEPFSVGPRNCIGKGLAWHEMRLLLATAVFNFDIELCDESQQWDQQHVFTFWEKKPLWCKMTPVGKAAQAA